MKRYYTLSSLLIALPLLALTSCDNMSASKSQSTPQSQNTTEDDTSLNRSISDALQRDTLYANSDITVASQGSQVRLSGTVASIQDKNRAGEIANKVQGVTKVSNNLEIVTPTKPIE